MRLRSLESRIVALFLILILIVQLVGFFFIQHSIRSNARASIQKELLLDEHVFQLLLKQNAQKLTLGANLLASDFGFKQAIATEDRETISSALMTLGDRIHASVTMLVGQNRMIKAATIDHPAASLQQSIFSLVDKAEQNGNAAGISIVDNHVYQIVLVPVKAPLTIGWVAMTFPIDGKLAKEIGNLSSLDVSILNRKQDGNWLLDASTLAAADGDTLTQRLQGLAKEASFDLIIDGSEYSARKMTLKEDAGQQAVVVLQRSVSKAIAPYNQLLVTLLILTMLGIAVAFGISVFIAKRITGPLRQLAETAKRLGAGDYQGQIEIRHDDEIGDLSKAFASMRDGISTREFEIRRLAYWDTLTSLPNRVQFVDLLSQAIAKARQYDKACYILMLDLDRFKNVNDVLGHGFGDALLRQVGERLKLQMVSAADQVARLGGDEFAILLPFATHDEAQAIAKRILQSLELPISLQEHTVDLGAGIGIAGFPQHGSDAQALLSHAEVAMSVAKMNGSVAVMYDPAIDKASQQNLSLLSELRRAIENDEFRLQVQPKLMLSTGRVIGLESLIRWMHPEKGMIFPDQFIPFAEKTGFIRKLTQWMLEQSAALCRELNEQGLYLKVSVNLSTRDLFDPDLPARFAEILSRNKVEPSSFCLEITESAIMDDPVRAQQTLEKLHAMNIDLAIDDFGTGYSSLAYLKRLPVDELKIDKSFVMNMEHDADDAKIVRSTIDLGHNMGLRVVAEGIESEVVWNLLARMGCDQAQGYFMSSPMPANQLIGWIENWLAPNTVKR